MNKNRETELIESLESCVNMQNIDVGKYFNNLKQLGKIIETKSDFKKVLEFCTILGNQERLKIIQILRDQDRCVCELEAILDKSQPTISHHLRELERLSLIRSFKQGKFTHYDLVEKQLQNYIFLMNKELGKK
ncbi:MAG: metalloregulator ArsR/SmtB family transcription factor [Candidatus Lokiarchaeota archaeon]